MSFSSIEKLVSTKYIISGGNRKLNEKNNLTSMNFLKSSLFLLLKKSLIEGSTSFINNIGEVNAIKKNKIKCQ